MSLTVKGLSKSYAAPVLKAIDLDLRPGEIRGLIGENGAGKSTLLNILSGQTRADSGSILLDGDAFAPASARAAMHAGVAMATQELSIIDTLTVADNLTLPDPPETAGVVARARQAEIATGMLEQLGLGHIAPDTLCAALNLAQKQLVEFGRAALRKSRLLLLDEPTAALSQHQADRLHEVMQAKAAAGCTILYVSHRLEDVRSVCDTVSVLRDGTLIATHPAQDFTVDGMIDSMMGQRIARTVNSHSIQSDSPAILKVSGLRAARFPTPIDLELRAGEIIGLAGLAGAGRSELLRAIMGLDRRIAGTVGILADGAFQPIRSAPEAVALGVGYVSEDRKDAGIFVGQDLAFNLELPAELPARGRNRYSGLSNRDILSKLQVRFNSLDQPIERLSGGNQQKIILGRWIKRETSVLLLDEPGRGIDVAAKLDIFAELRTLTRAGAAVLMASSEIEELCDVCDRIVVLSDGHIAAEFAREAFDQNRILEAAFSKFLQEKN